MNDTKEAPRNRLDRAGFGQVVGELPGELLAKVYALLAFSVASAVVGGFVGYRLDASWMIVLFPLELVLVVGINFLREREGWNIVVLYAFSFVSGLTMGPLLSAYADAGMGSAVLQAAAVTGVMATGLATFALKTESNFARWQGFLLTALVGLIAACIANLFIGGAVLYAATGWAGAVVFSLLLVYDVNRIRYLPDTMGNAVVITLDIYLDLLNLFLFVLQILGGGDD